MTVPNVIGYYLGDARKILDRADVDINSIKVTAPPRNVDKNFDDTYMVVWQGSTNEKTIDLLVCKPLDALVGNA